MSPGYNDDSDSTEIHDREYQKGVKHLYENGIDHVPAKYILPENERPRNAETGCNIQLPVIDCAELKGPGRSKALASLAYACQTYGFFQLTNHGISDRIIRNMSDVSKRFFALPMGEREKYMSADVSSPVRYGTSFNQSKDEFFCWRDFLKLVCHPQPHVLPHFPSSPPDLKDSVVGYARETKLLFLLLVKAILESLGLDELAHDDDDILKELEKGSQMMVMNYYPPCPQPELTIGMPPHSDYGFLTLLLQDDVPGLQIHHNDNWLTVEPIPESFVINVGDNLEIFSNGRYKSVLHRVLANSIDYRISIASLHSVSFAYKVRPSSKLIDDQNPRRYKDSDFQTFLEFVKSEDCRHKSFLESRKV